MVRKPLTQTQVLSKRASAILRSPRSAANYLHALKLMTEIERVGQRVGVGERERVQLRAAWRALDKLTEQAVIQ
jgi:hypothetical protein